MKEYKAPDKRTGKEEIINEMKLVTQSQVLKELMQTFNGILAVLDSNRQIVAINENVLKMTSHDNTEVVIGFRLGEVLNCIYAKLGPDGCGTGPYCMTCGAGTAICDVLLGKGEQNEICSLTVEDGDKKANLDYALQVRTKEFIVDNHDFVLLLIQDITNQEFWSSLERVFFHDIGNVITSLLFSSELLSRKMDPGEEPLVESIQKLSQRLSREITIQRYLSNSEKSTITPRKEEISLYNLIKEIEEIFHSMPGSSKHKLNIFQPESDLIFVSDYSIVIRTLTNLIKNAVEAKESGGEIKISFDICKRQLSFMIWNDSYIPKEVQLRIFQRHFSTKEGSGRGIGTFSMKLFAEKILKGSVEFKSSKEKGTTFVFSLPL